MTSQVRDRQEISEEFKWNLAAIYPTEKEWEADFVLVPPQVGAIEKYRGGLGDSVENLAKVFELEDQFSRLVYKLYTYAHLMADQDTTNTHYMGLQDRIRTLSVQASARLAWIEPEILALPESKLNAYLQHDVMRPYHWALKQLLRNKPHTLSEKEEKILSQAMDPLSTPQQAFGMLNNADLKFPVIEDADGKSVELTHGNYSRFLESQDRATRRRAFEAMYGTYLKLKNTFATVLSGQVKTHTFSARVRGFKSALEASLFQDNIDPAVYNNLIQTVHRNLPSFYEYVRLRKKLLQIDDLEVFDLYVPLVKELKLDIPFETARKWILASVEPLGEEYVKSIRRAFDERWIDVYENRGKRSGAYSSGCYDTNPYILMNYNNTLHSVFTLAHELGHSMHTHLSCQNQPHIYSKYRIFVAEVASTTNETLLQHYLMTNPPPEYNTQQLQTYILNHACEDFRGTLFRQTMFAEFEKLIHEKSEAGVPLTPDSLTEWYSELNKKYYGPDLVQNPTIGNEWMRIPHFYYNFYVYKYATGISAAQSFTQRILSGDKTSRELYLNFLKAGSSKYPLDLLRDAGVDLNTPAPIESALAVFRERLGQLTKSLG